MPLEGSAFRAVPLRPFPLFASFDCAGSSASRVTLSSAERTRKRGELPFVRMDGLRAAILFRLTSDGDDGSPFSRGEPLVSPLQARNAGRQGVPRPFPHDGTKTVAFYGAASGCASLPRGGGACKCLGPCRPLRRASLPGNATMQREGCSEIVVLASTPVYTSQRCKALR